MLTDDDKRCIAASEAGRILRAMIRAGTKAYEPERASVIFKDLSKDVYEFLSASSQGVGTDREG